MHHTVVYCTISTVIERKNIYDAVITITVRIVGWKCFFCEFFRDLSRRCLIDWLIFCCILSRNVFFSFFLCWIMDKGAAATGKKVFLLHKQTAITLQIQPHATFRRSWHRTLHSRGEVVSRWLDRCITGQGIRMKSHPVFDWRKESMESLTQTSGERWVDPLKNRSLICNSLNLCALAAFSPPKFTAKAGRKVRPSSWQAAVCVKWLTGFSRCI